MKSSYIYLYAILMSALFVLGSTVPVSASFDYDFVGISADSDRLAEFFSPVHYVGNGNNFAGGFFWLNSVPVNVTISANNGSVLCRRQVRGFYYNPARGNRLWPIDSASLAELRTVDASYNNLTVAGGIYTNCEGQGGYTTSPYARYGRISYNANGDESTVFAGMQIDFANGSVVTNLRSSLEAFDNKTMLGYVYDTRGGLGYVGGKFPNFPSLTCYETVANETTTNSINNIFTYDSSDRIVLISNAACTYDAAGAGTAMAQAMSNITIMGNAALSRSMDRQDLQSLMGNFGSRSQLQGTITTLGEILGKIRPTANDLCRGKWGNVIPSNLASSESVICVEFASYDDDNIVTLDIAGNQGNRNNTYNNKSFIVRNGNLVINGSMHPESSVHVFVDNGNLLFQPPSVIPGGLQSVDNKGYAVATNGVGQGMMINGNFYVNGLVMGYDGSNFGTFANRIFVHGRFGSLSTPLASTEARNRQLDANQATKDHVAFANFQDTFTWNCNVANGLGTDNTSCGSNADENAFSSLVFIDRSYPNPLLK